MKLAIIGSSPLALETALRFHDHGAAISWFLNEEEEIEHLFEELTSPEDFVSSLGQRYLNQSYKTTHFSFDHWKKNYFIPLKAILELEHKVKNYEVLAISKRYLAKNESISSSSRFADLFRVIYQLNPMDFIEEQKESNPENYERLSEEFKNSLHSKLEMFEDFDLVIDLRRTYRARSISISGRALGEKRVPKEHIFYGVEALRISEKINSMGTEDREIALLGSGALSAATLVKLADWMKDERTRIFVGTEEALPFEDFFKSGNPMLVAKLKELLNHLDEQFEAETNEFHAKLREWQALDDFVQVKKPRPVEPIPRVVYFSGHNATAIDMLIDKRRVFLTLEKPDFREGLKHPDNNLMELKTIGVDKILVCHPPVKTEIEVFLNDKEIGFFAIDAEFSTVKESWQKDLEKLKGIENEIFKLFSPSGTH